MIKSVLFRPDQDLIEEVGAYYDRHGHGDFCGVYAYGKPELHFRYDMKRRRLSIGGPHAIPIESLSKGAREQIEEIAGETVRRELARHESVRIVVREKTGAFGKWRVVGEKLRSELFPALDWDTRDRTTADVIALERELNNGLLAHEAEVAYARMGRHDHKIFCVTRERKKQ